MVINTFTGIFDTKSPYVFILDLFIYFISSILFYYAYVLNIFKHVPTKITRALHVHDY